MIQPKLLIVILASSALCFSAMAENEEALPSIEEQCSENSSYIDASGYWHECDVFENQGSGENQEWPESAGEREEYEQDENENENENEDGETTSE